MSGSAPSGAVPVEAAPSPQPPTTVMFTSVEFMALLARRPGPAAEISREQLAIAGGDPDGVRAGTRSLVDRGYLADGRGAVEVPGPADVVGHALTTDGVWTTVVVADRDGIAPCLLLDGEPVHLWITPYPDRTFAVTALRTAYPRAALRDSMIAHLESTVPSEVSIGVRTARGARDEVMVSRSPDGRWWLQQGDDAPVAGSRHGAVGALDRAVGR